MTFYIKLKNKTNVLNEYLFKKDEVLVGRSPENDIVINDLTVSLKHLKITKQINKIIVEDLHSTNGTFIDNQRIEKATVDTNTQIKISEYILKLKYFDIDIPRTILKVIENPYDKTTLFKLNRITTYIGNKRRADIPIRLRNDFLIIPDYIASISFREGKFILNPLNPEFVIHNTKNINKKTELKDKDIIEIGITKFIFQYIE